MKKFSVVLSSLVIGATLANADFLSISAGVGYEQQKISGYVKNKNTINYFGNHTPYGGNVGYLGLDDKTNPYVWIKFIHPLPIVPNIKFQYTKYSSTGHSNYVAGGVKIFNDVNIPLAITNASTKMDINSYDFTLFYEFNPLFADMEAGFGADIWQGNTKIYDNNTNKEIVNEDFTVVLPYLYGHIETMNLFGFSAIANVKWAKAGDNHHYDYVGALKYTIDIPAPINPFIKVGYRYKDVYGVDGDTTTKLKYKGVFAEIGAKF